MSDLKQRVEYAKKDSSSDPCEDWLRDLVQELAGREAPQPPKEGYEMTDGDMEELEFYRLCNAYCFNSSQSEYIDGLLIYCKKGQRPHVRKLLDFAYTEGYKNGMLAALKQLKISELPPTPVEGESRE